MKTTALLSLGVIVALSGCGPVVEVFSGDELLQNSRPALAEDGTVVAAEAHRIHVGLGEETKVLSVPAELEIHQDPLRVRRLIRVRSEGDIVFVTQKTDATCTTGPQRGGVYRTDKSGANVSEVFSSCVPTIPLQVAMSPNGTVAFSTVVNGAGAIWRGPVDGAVSVLRSGSGRFTYNTFDDSFDVSDEGNVLAEMEYLDIPLNKLSKGVFLFATPEQGQDETHTLMEKLPVGAIGEFALNQTGGFIWATNGESSRDGIEYAPGIYRVTPTPFNAPKDLTKLVGPEDGYCAFGEVDLNDHGEFVFEAARPDGSGACLDVEMDGIFRGPDPVFNAVILRGASTLGQHAQFDKIVLGELNNQGELSFLTTSSKAGVPKTKVWRSDAVRRARGSTAQ